MIKIDADAIVHHNVSNSQPGDNQLRPSLGDECYDEGPPVTNSDQR